jgi:hypothetical protein
MSNIQNNNNIPDDKFKEYVKNSNTWLELLKKCGYNNRGNDKTVKKRCDKMKIDYSHITNYVRPNNTKKYPLNEILIENSSYINMVSLKCRLKKELKWAHECSICKLSKWMNKDIPLEIDHINGVHNDNRIDNIRFICPNCHAQTDTYKGKNVKKDTIAKHKIEKLCSCGKKIHFKSSNCNNCVNILRLKKAIEGRPTYEELKDDITKMPYVAVGKKYNVSDNTIRSWIKSYEKLATINNNINNTVDEKNNDDIKSNY